MILFAAWVVAGTAAYYLWVRPGQAAEQLRKVDSACENQVWGEIPVDLEDLSYLWPS